MKTIKLSKEQQANLNAFLSRVELKGSEVPAFVEIINAINAEGEEI
jgi:hypothetical protein